MGGGVELGGASLAGQGPWGAPREKNILINNNETHPAMWDLTRPGPEARQIAIIAVFVVLLFLSLLVLLSL